MDLTEDELISVNPEHLGAKLDHGGLNNKSAKMEVLTSPVVRCRWAG